jgi:predicted hotdog family 3-hydroxylacyl-ACP dehydratase
MASSGMLRRVALVRKEVSEELSASWYLVFLCSVRRLLVTARVVPISPSLVTLMKEALSYRRGNLKCSIALTCWAL